MLVYGASLDLNWLLRLLGLAENRVLISNYSNTRPLLLLSIFLAIVLRLCLLHLAENRAPTSNANEVDQSLKPGEQQEPSDQIDHNFEGVEQPGSDRTTSPSGRGCRRHGACAFCGNLSTTRCSRCKAARYCSETCQIRHWILHKYECMETETVDQEGPARGASRIVKTKKESSNGSNRVEWNSEVGEVDSIYRARRQLTDASSDGVSGCYSCAVCGGPTTTRCSRCKAVRYCSVKCLITDWRWHKVQCVAEDVGIPKNSNEEENNDHSPDPLSLEFYPERTTNIKPLIESSQELTKKAQDLTVEGVRCLEEEVAKSRNEIMFLQAERDKWAMRANFAKERYQSFKKETEHQLFALKKEKELISNAEKQAQNMVHSLSERLHHLQSKCAQLKRGLQEEQEHIQRLTTERDEIHETAQIALREVEEKGKELQVEQERVQQLKEGFLRDVTAAESRAVVAEAKLRDLERKIRSTNNKVAVWRDSFGRPAMACAICLTNEKNLAFGCGHMTCRDCGSKISKCPICREQITSHIRLFPG